MTNSTGNENKRCVNKKKSCCGRPFVVSGIFGVLALTVRRRQETLNFQKGETFNLSICLSAVWTPLSVLQSSILRYNVSLQLKQLKANVHFVEVLPRQHC